MAEDITEALTLYARAVVASATPQLVDPHERLYVVPRDFELKFADTINVSPHPRRSLAKVTFWDPTSLAEYVTKHHEPGTQLYADAVNRRIVAVLNDHEDSYVDGEDGAPGWRDHVATLDVRPSDQWQAWCGADGKQVDQITFAEFIEDHASDVGDPPPADLVEMALHLQAHRDVQFRSVAVLANGQRQLTYDETINARVGRGELTVPDTVTLCLPIFEGTEPVLVRARFRYRLRGQELTMGIVLHRRTEIERAAFEGIVESVRDAIPRDTAVYIGAPGLTA